MKNPAQNIWRKSWQIFTDTFSIGKEEFIKIFKDGGVLLLFLGATLLYPLIYSFCYNPEVLKDVPVAVVDLDNSSTSRQFIRMVDASEQIMVLSKPSSYEEAMNEFNYNRVHGVIVIPKDFNRNVLRGERTNVFVYTDAAYLLFYKQVYQGVSYVAGTFNAGLQVKKLMAKGVQKDQAIKNAQPISLQSEPLFNPAGGYGSYALPAILILILQQTLLMGIGMLGATEKESGGTHYLAKYAQLRGGTIRLIIGKASAYFLLYLGIAFYLLMLIARWFHLPQHGNPLHVLVFIIPLLLSAIFLGFYLTSFFRNRENSIVFILFTSIPLLFLSGFGWPVESFPKIFQWFAHIVPSTSAIRGFLKINQMGANLHDVASEWLELWVLTVFYLILAVWKTYSLSHKLPKEEVS